MSYTVTTPASPGTMKEKNVILVFFVLIHASHGKRYDLPAGWRGTNFKLNLTTVDLPSTSQTTPSSSFRILKDGNNTDITSDNATFALAFYDLGNTGAFYLSVMLRAPDPSAALPVWIANRNHPVGESSYLLMAHENGKLLLIDQANLGMPAWAPSASHVVTLGLQESGNLCLYAQDGSLVWESFEDLNPTDTLLPNQLLKPGMQLSGRANESSVLFGEYSGGIDSSGLTLSVNKLGLSPQAYQVWRLNQQVKCSHPALGILGFNVQLECGSSKLSIPFDDRPLLPFLRLETDGDLVVYGFYPERSSWSPVFRLSSLRTDTCKLPNTCGPYGICETGNRCRCIQVESGNETYSAVPRTGRCSESIPRGAPRGLPQPDACANENLNHHLVNVTGVSYFAIPYMESSSRTTIESCAASCRWNCSCAALFFNRRTGECFFVVDEILGSLTIDPERSDDMIAMLKFVNRHLLTGPQPINESVSPPSKDPRAGRVKKIVSIAAAVVGGCLIVFLFACVILSRRRSGLHKKDSDELDMDEFLSGVQGLPQRISYSALEAATRGFTTKLGSGGFGSVYEGVLNGRTVAVKKLEGNGSQGARQFIAEVATIGSISHVNVVKLSGFCVESSHRMLVYEFMPNGSLDRWLFPNREHGEEGTRTPDRRGLSWERRMDVALGTARGLAYLHEECREPIIHLDVKPQNILLDERFAAKVADFGMSKLLDNRDVSHVVTGVRGTPGYLAPEWLLHSIATKKCDVYSYGMVLLEMVGGRRNIEASRMSSDLSWYFPAWVVNEAREGRFLELVDKTIRESAPEKQVKKMIHIALWCVQENSGSRPTMQEVVLMIEGLKEVLDPPMTFHFAVQTMVDITTSSDCASTAYISRPSLDISSLIR